MKTYLLCLLLVLAATLTACHEEDFPYFHLITVTPDAPPVSVEPDVLPDDIDPAELDAVVADLEEVVTADDPDAAAAELVDELADAEEGSLAEEVAAEVEAILDDDALATVPAVEELIEAVTAPDAPEAARECKGNINSRKEKIVHCPGDISYNVTIVTESRGEIWCMLQECLDAGWRRALR